MTAVGQWCFCLSWVGGESRSASGLGAGVQPEQAGWTSPSESSVQRRGQRTSQKTSQQRMPGVRGPPEGRAVKPRPQVEREPLRRVGYSTKAGMSGPWGPRGGCMEGAWQEGVG